uniref:Terpene synthase n=1 Tax=Pelargonium graveolens TaxID=73200 RepID=A0A2S1JKY7_9ROSI|nr:terpene synthase [Pelargonium graveolens]
MASQLVSVASSCSKGEVRSTPKFHPSVWADRFTSFTPSSLANSPHDSYSAQIQVLKVEVGKMLSKASSTGDLFEKITLINSLCRLGISYHFEEEIGKQLKHIFDTKSYFDSSDDHDLYTCALVFRVLRQHGYRMSCEIFNKFKDSKGEFSKTLASDVRGMLSLYEASHLRVHGEDILDEALVFTRTHLETLVHHDPTHALAQQVVQALELPLHKGMPRLETRRYISFYQNDATRNETLLKFAKLDFNLLQLLQQQELGHIQRWWKELNFASKLSYARDRIVECYFWMLGVYYEPHYSHARIMLTKIIGMLSIIDDTYDVYATFEETKLFTDAIQRWDCSAVEQLPDYMQIVYNFILSLYQELEKEVTDEGRSYTINYGRESIKEVVRGYYKEIEWLNRDICVPPFDEYLENALTTSASQTLALSSLIGMKIAGKHEFEWIQSIPKCVKACQIVGRLQDDIMSHKFEQERKHIASSVECLMAQYGVSEEEAIGELQKMVENAWKDLNEECLSRPSDVSMHILMRVLNLARTTEVVYTFDDGYTNSHKHLKEYITYLFVDPISTDDDSK